MLGDVIDFWWKPTADVVQESSNLMLELSSLDMKKYYLVGNHDFDFKKLYPLETDFEVVEGLSSTKSSTGNEIVYDSTLQSGDRNFRLIHGHQVSYWHALPFYEAFCKAMCGRMDTVPISNVWDALLVGEKTSQKIQTEIRKLSNVNRAKLEYYLAGPLEPNPDDEPKSVLDEWQILRRFEDKERNLDTFHDHETFMEVRSELESVMSILGNQYKGLPIDSEKDVLETFSIVWKEILRTIDLISEDKLPRKTHENIILKARRIAAMITTSLRSNEFLIHGHSHQAYLSKNQMSADPGHWLGTAGAYLVIDDGKISLQNWNTR